MRRAICAASLLFVSLVSTAAIAQAPPTADTYVSGSAPTTNHGTATSLSLGTNEYTFLSFNLAGIPSNATIEKATLKLFVDGPVNPKTGSFDVYEIDTAWSEKTLDWNNKPVLGMSATGGNPVTLNSSSYRNYVLVDITTLVQNWVNGTTPNNGVALALTTGSGPYTFDSKEATATSHPAELEIAIPGAQGPQGPQGPAGPQGPEGLQGLPGNLNPGSPYYVQNGTSQQASANFNIAGSGTANSFNSNTTYQIGASPVVSIGSATDANLFMGVGAGQNNIPGQGNVNVFSGNGAGYSNTTGYGNVFTGYEAGYANTTGKHNVFTGTTAGASNTTGYHNVFTGYGAGLRNTAGYYNVFTGPLAGLNNTTGAENVFTGPYAGSDNTTGYYNVFTGFEAGTHNTTGYFNVFTGTYAGYANTFGENNVFTGYQAGYVNTTGVENIFTGTNAGYANTTGSYNVFTGTDAGTHNTTGYFNVFTGTYAGLNNTTGYSNVFEGFEAGVNIVGGSNDIDIGSGTTPTGDESNTIRIGDGQTATYIAGIYGATSSGGAAVYVNSAGQLGTLTSSRRFKENINDMSDSTSKLLQLRPVTFFYKPEYDDGSHQLQYGLIAEEVAKVYPELVDYDKDGQPYTVKYQYLTTMLLNEMQKQRTVIGQQKEEIRSQQAQIEAMKLQLQQQSQEFELRLSRLERSPRVGSSILAANKK